VTTARRYRTVTIQAGEQTLTAADPLPDGLREAIIAIRGGHSIEPSQVSLLDEFGTKASR
ncbi:hypothetical protein ABLE94_26135, partial [Gordonia sp. VNK1]|uniref:hypothetical protein n=1 Tax=Gordonia oleivorans TaxID=3156618 RepID=UPI0032B5DA4A